MPSEQYQAMVTAKLKNKEFKKALDQLLKVTEALMLVHHKQTDTEGYGFLISDTDIPKYSISIPNNKNDVRMTYQVTYQFLVEVPEGTFVVKLPVTYNPNKRFGRPVTYYPGHNTFAFNLEVCFPFWNKLAEDYINENNK